MTPMRWLYAAFWIIIGVLLLMQFSNYNSHLDKVQAATPPQQQHYYFIHGQASTSTLGPPPKPDTALIRQVSFTTEKDVPSPGSFTCHITLKNEGTLKAVSVRIMASPFHGIQMGDSDNGNSTAYILPDTDPVVQNNSQWVNFPDLAPGESNTQDVTFLNQPGYNPGDNSQPQIIYNSEKPKPQPVTPAPVAPPTL